MAAIDYNRELLQQELIVEFNLTEEQADRLILKLMGLIWSIVDFAKNGGKQ